MTLRIPAKVLIHVWSYDFYDMTLSTGKQRRHMINCFKKEQLYIRYLGGLFLSPSLLQLAVVVSKDETYILLQLLM